MNPPEIYKMFGPISVCVTWLAVGLLVYKWRGDRSMSISKHAAAHKTSYLMMLLVESIVLPMFFLFIAKWLAPALDLPRFFTIIVGITCSGLLVAAWIPDVNGWKGKVHSLSAYGAAMCFIPASTILYISPNVPAFARNFSLLVLIYELLAVSVFVTMEKAREYHLYVQVVYILLFDLAALSAAYVR